MDTKARKGRKKTYERIASIIDNHQAMPQRVLIKNLNPIIKGWANYYSTVVSKKVYSQLDHLLYLKLATWAKRRHPHKSVEWMTKKYWRTIDGNHWVFSTPQSDESPMRIYQHAEKPISRHVKVKGVASPYNGDLIYWSSRMGTHPEMPKTLTTPSETTERKMYPLRTLFPSRRLVRG